MSLLFGFTGILPRPGDVNDWCSRRVTLPDGWSSIEVERLWVRGMPYSLTARHGDFEGLLAVLDPDVVFRADHAAQRLGSLAEIRGAAAVAETFKGRAQAAKPALVDGALGLAVIFGGQLRIVLHLTIAGDRISAVEAVADAERIGTFDVAVL